MICNKECEYRTPYGYCGVTTCCNLVTTTAQPSHFREEKEMEDIKKYAVKGHIPLVNEGIQEGRKLVFCKDCKYWSERFEECHIWDGVDVLNIKADDFCSKGVKK